MWQRTVEAMLAIWLAMSAFIFQYPDDKVLWWWHDWIVALVVILLATGSLLTQLRHAHFLELVVAVWLIGHGWFAASEGLGAPAMQNWICLGLLLLMTAIIPTDSTATPIRWRNWYQSQGLEPPVT